MMIRAMKYTYTIQVNVFNIPDTFFFNRKLSEYVFDLSIVYRTITIAFKIQVSHFTKMLIVFKS